MMDMINSTLLENTLYQDEITTDKKPTVVYSIRDDISDGYSILG